MKRTKQQLEQIAIAIMDHYTGLPAPECIAPEWGIGIALLRATGREDLTCARRIEAAFSELMNQFAEYGEGWVMTESKHTPGPWEAGCGCSLPGFIAMVQSNKPYANGNVIFHPEMIAISAPQHSSPLSQDEKKANARLIAAAPELFELAKYVSMNCGGYESSLADDIIAKIGEIS